MRCIVSLLLLLVTFIAGAQNYELSEKIDIPLTGWNKVLQVSNGNTLLFHFEARKPLVVKLFDTTRREIASEKFIGKLVDNNAFERSDLLGIYEVGGEAVIFLSQAINNAETLVRICFNINTGKLITEKPVIASESFRKRYTFSLARNNVKGGYAVFCMKDLVANFQDDPHLEIFDEKHNSVKKVVFKTPRNEFDKVKHVNTCVGNDGTVAVIFNGSKIIKYPNEEQCSMISCYVGEGDNEFSIATTRLPQYMAAQYGLYSYNEFAQTRNIMMVAAAAYTSTNGLEKTAEIIYSPFMLMYKKDNLADMNSALMNYPAANKHLQDMTDTTHFITPAPIRLYTNKFGMSTVISEEIKHNLRLQGVLTNHCYIGDIVVSQMNDEGRETWSTIIPNRQYVRNLLTIHDIKSRGELTSLFRRTDPTSDWLYQFTSFNSFMNSKGDCYIIHNDVRQNFKKTLSDKITPMSTYTVTDLLDADAIIYKITKKREVEKQFLLGESNTANYSAMIESADYHDKLLTYATLFVQRDGKDLIQKIGWKKLDN